MGSMADDMCAGRCSKHWVAVWMGHGAACHEQWVTGKEAGAGCGMELAMGTEPHDGYGKELAQERVRCAEEGMPAMVGWQRSQRTWLIGDKIAHV